MCKFFFSYAIGFVLIQFVFVRKHGELCRVYITYAYIYIISLLLNWTDIAVLFIVICH